MHDG